jgi:uncharacterized protein YndB with AHSA1/START domain
VSARSRPVGLTRDAGWQVGVSRTVAFDHDAVWPTLTSPAGLAAWLGEGAEPDHEVGAPYTNSEGTTGEMRSWREGDRLRATRRAPGDDHETTVQVTVSEAATGTRLVFHQERMASQSERLAMRTHWRAVADRLEELIGRDAPAD